MRNHGNSQHILEQADQCVMCGLCLPHCATYLERRNENESPRGRISLIQGYLRDQFPASDSLQQHLEQCLLCRSCETMCPSNVPFGDIMEQARLQLRQEKPAARLSPFLQKMLVNSDRMHGKLLRLYQRTGLQWLLRHSGIGQLLFGDRINLLPPIPTQKKLSHYYPARGERLGQVALFTGCISQVIERQFLRESIVLLQAAGYDVYVPPTQVCCGAMHFHSGDTSQSQDFLQQNRQAFGTKNYNSVIYLASGCGLFLHEHLAENGISFTNIYSFLLENGQRLSFQPLSDHVSVHTPCSLRQLPGAEQDMLELLEKIPGIDITFLEQNNICCGGAGSSLLQQSKLAKELRERKATILEQQSTDYVLTSNTGCYLQLCRAVREHQYPVQVCYPTQLLSGQLVP